MATKLSAKTAHTGTSKDPRAADATAQTILIIDDEADARAALADLLEGCGYEVETAANGREALEFLRTNPAPAVIVLDLLMPVMDGWQFRLEQKRFPDLANIPVVALTALRQLPDFDAAAVVHKPVEFKRLLNAIRRCCPEPV